MTSSDAEIQVQQEADPELLLALARAVTARRSLADVLATAFRCLHDLLPFDGGSIQLLDDEGWIRLAATEPAAPPDVLALRIPLAETVAGRIILSERAVYIPDVLAEADVPAGRRRAHLSPGGVRSYLGVPLIAEGRAIGVVQVDSPVVDAWTGQQQLLVGLAAPVIAAAVHSAHAYAANERTTAEVEQLASRQQYASERVAGLLEEVGELRTDPSPVAVEGLVAGLLDLQSLLSGARESKDRLPGPRRAAAAAALSSRSGSRARSARP